MAAARLKEINVSITEDATMSLTRSEGGAKVVRVDAIAIVPAPERAFLGCGCCNHRPHCDEFISKSRWSQWLRAGHGELRPQARDSGGSSLPKSSTPSSTKLMSTTTAEPARPAKNMISNSRIATITKSISKL